MLVKINISILFFVMASFRTNNISISSSDITSAIDTTYVLKWSDEFNTDGLPDAKNWEFENGFVRNHELQWYQKDNAVCKNGVAYKYKEAAFLKRLLCIYYIKFDFIDNSGFV